VSDDGQTGRGRGYLLCGAAGVEEGKKVFSGEGFSEAHIAWSKGRGRFSTPCKEV
jgi:alanine dehydrogenase